jgi:hypothetical protein
MDTASPVDASTRCTDFRRAAVKHASSDYIVKFTRDSAVCPKPGGGPVGHSVTVLRVADDPADNVSVRIRKGAHGSWGHALNHPQTGPPAGTSKRVYTVPWSKTRLVRMRVDVVTESGKKYERIKRFAHCHA